MISKNEVLTSPGKFLKERLTGIKQFREFGSARYRGNMLQEIHLPALWIIQTRSGEPTTLLLSVPSPLLSLATTLASNTTSDFPMAP
jgi:hypothetical protein